MERKDKIILSSFALFTIILISIVIILNTDDETCGVHDYEPNDYNWEFGSTIPSYRLNISDNGYDILNIGPFIASNGDAISGLVVSIHLSEKNISAITGSAGSAPFNISFPIEYNLYQVTTHYNRKMEKKWDIYLEVIHI